MHFLKLKQITKVIIKMKKKIRKKSYRQIIQNLKLQMDLIIKISKLIRNLSKKKKMRIFKKKLK